MIIKCPEGGLSAMNKGIGIGVVFLMIGLLLLALTASDAYMMSFGKVSIEETGYGSYENSQIAEGDIGFVIDKVGEAKLTKKIFGIPYKKVSAPLFMIMDNGGYVLLHSNRDEQQLERIRQQTADYYSSGSSTQPPEAIHYVGKATEVSDEIMDVLEKFFSEKGISEEAWQNAMSLYVLVEFDSSIVVIQLCIACGLILIGIFMMIFFRRYVQGEVVFVGEKPPTENDKGLVIPDSNIKE